MTDPTTAPQGAVSPSMIVLAVDDDALVQMNTVAMLEELGHRVIEASNGADALEALRAHPEISLVLTDFAMPNMTGRDLVLAIARERPGLPVVLATGYAELPGGVALEADRLAKPFGLDELERAIAKAVNR